MIKDITNEQVDIFLDTLCNDLGIKLNLYQRWFIKRNVLRQPQKYICFSTYRRNRCDFRQLAYLMSVLNKIEDTSESDDT